MSTVTEVLQIFFSWPIVAIISVIILRKSIQNLLERLIKSDSAKAKVGPIEIELGKIAEEHKEAVVNLNRLNFLMAESRLLELEMTEEKFGMVFTSDQRKKMLAQIDELKKLTEQTETNS